MIICLLVFAALTAMTFLLPKTYEAVTRLKVNVPPGNYPPDYLGEAIATSDQFPCAQARRRIARPFPAMGQALRNHGAGLNEAQVVSLLRRMVNVRQVGNSTVLEIHVFSHS